MDPIRVYINKDNLASIRCPQCGKQKFIEATKFKDYSRPITVRCSCGRHFSILLEKRKYSRTLVNFVGKCSHEGPGDTERPIIIEDLSRNGIRFLTETPNELKVGQAVRVRFVLDDERRNPVDIGIVVKRVKDTEVGGQFADNPMPHALAVYLMP